MSSSNNFHIMIDVKDKGKFRMEVEHYYSSPQVERFKIKGKNDRYILMEKRLELKRQPWKVTKVDITTTNYQEASMALRDMQDAIDNYLDQRDGQAEGFVAKKK
jgi:hypothetical protein